MHVINAHTGEEARMMSVEGVEALTFALVNAEYSEDGSILACPLTLHANIESGWGSGYFTIYRWENEDSDPEPFIVYSEKDLRLGEGLTVIGDVTDDAVIMAGASGVRTVLRWIITDGVIGDVEEITLPETVNTGIVATACPTGLTAADGFWYNNASSQPVLCNADGTVVGEIPAEVVSAASGQIRLFSYDSKDMMLVADTGRAVLIDITGKQPGDITIDDIVTFTKGVANSSQLAGADYRIGADNSLAIFSFSSANGLWASATEAAPVASDLKLDGLTLIGESVSYNYTYGDLNGDIEDNTEIKWYLSDDEAGTNKTEILEAAGRTGYILQEADLLKYISYSILPAAATGLSSHPSFLVESPYFGPVIPADARAPIATDVAITGAIAVNEELTGSYTYSDENDDLEGESIIQWWTADDDQATNLMEIASASGSLSYTVMPDDAGKYILFSVTPVAQTGVLLTGDIVIATSDSAVFLPEFLPVASDLAITGREEVAGILTGTYNYSDLNGDEEGETLIKWWRADDAEGTNKTEVASDTLIYTLVAEDEGKFIILEVTPVTVDGETGDPAMVATGQIAPKPAPEAPVATDVMVHGIPEVGAVLYGSYTYTDRTDDPEGATVFKWYTADDAAGTNKAEISGANKYAYLVTEDVIGKHIIFEVTPVATIGELLEGDPVMVGTEVAATASTNDGAFERVWLRAAKLEGVPEYIGTGSTERGFAAGTDHLYIASRKDGTKLLVVDKADGSLVGEMNTEGMDVGLFKISDVEVSADGQILACPLQINAMNEPFVVYKWEDELAAPTKFIEFTSAEAMRLGDKFTVIGDVSSDAVIYAAASAGTKVIRWVVTGGIVDAGTVIELEGTTSIGSTAAAGPFGETAESNFIVDGRGFQAQIFDKDGNYVGALEGIGQSNNQSNSPNVFYYKGRTLVAFHQKNDAGQWNVIVQDITGDTHITVGSSEVLSDANQELGGVHVQVDEDYFHLFMLSANQGLAYWKGMLELPTFSYAETNEAGTEIHVRFSKNMPDSVGFTTGWTVLADDSEIVVDTLYGTGTDPDVVTFVLETAIAEGQTVTIAYDGTGSVVAFDGMPLNAFEAQTVVNTVGAEAPVASDVTITGEGRVGSELVGNYTYTDANGDVEEGSTYQWWYASDAAGSDKLKLLGENSTTYTVTEDVAGKYVAFEVIPVTATGGEDYLVGEPAVSDFMFIIGVGIDDDFASQVKVYPNPVADVLTIDNCSDVQTITLIDLSGKILMSKTNMGENNVKIDMNAYQKGMYILKLTGENGAARIESIVKTK
jgi:hypothetical protein